MSRQLVFLGSIVLLGTTWGVPSQVSAQAMCVGNGTGDACLAALERIRGPSAVVNDIFQTSDGLYAPQLTFARHLRGSSAVGYSGWRACATPVAGNPCGCNGQAAGQPRYHCPSDRLNISAYGTGLRPGETVDMYANSLDWLWTQVFRSDPVSGAALGDGDPNHYLPWRGRVYDLGGEANRVVVFPITDHGPLPCEAFEYSIWLSNNPNATEVAPMEAPDPNKWNPAIMVRVFREGWTRNPLAEGAVDAARPNLGAFLRDLSNGDAAADALVTVWALPCGISFRYAATQGGNWGNPHPDCAFHSNEDEMDALAGLNEDDTAICVDADLDGHRAASCGGSDCDDSDPAVHPGAFEPCDATRDFDCQPAVACPAQTTCDATSGLCVTMCFEGACSEGYTCVDEKCVESACAARTEPCPAGTLCRNGSCVAPCEGVVCPARQLCIGGACIDPCEGVACPTNQVCTAYDPTAGTVCGPACTCTELAAPLCRNGTVCDAREGSTTAGTCVAPGCETAVCGPSETCASGSCVDACAGVTCPRNQVCSGGACVTDQCARITCTGGQVCRDGACRDRCAGISCNDGQICRSGACVPDPCFGITCSEGQRCSSGTCIPDGARGDGGAGRRDGGGGGGDDGGCGCRAVGARKAERAWWFLGLFAAYVVRRARRRAAGTRERA